MKQALAVAILVIILGFVSCRGDGMMRRSQTEQSQQQDVSPSMQVPDDLVLFPPKTETKLQQMLAETVKDENIPGLVFYVATSDGIWMGAEGDANQEAGVVLKPTDRFRIGNLTALFVSVLCLQLSEDGLLDLNAPIANYLPADVSDRIVRSDRITVRQLLNHTSGLPTVYTDGFTEAVRTDPNRDWTPEDILAYIYDVEPATVSGAFSYSSANYLLLELIIETVTGKPLESVMRDRITSPLGLTNTFLELRDPIPGGFTQGYQDWDEDGVSENVTTPLLNNGLGLGDKGMVSNAPDLVRFLHGLFLDSKLLYPTSLDTMLTSVATYQGNGYGLGINHMTTPWGEAWGQVGTSLGFQSVILYLPVHDLTLVVWTNEGDRTQVNPLEIAESGLSIILGEPK